MGSTGAKSGGKDKADRSKERAGKVETDRNRYDKAGKGKDPGKLKDIPTKDLERMMKSDKDAWRAGETKAELNRREKERRDYDRKREKSSGGGKKPREGGRRDR